MLSGIIDSENYSQVLRSISKQKGQGILSLRFPHGSIDLFFVRGKIIDVIKEWDNRLERFGNFIAGYSGVERLLVAGDDFSTIWSGLSEQISGKLTQEIFRKIIEAYVHNDLMEIDWGGGALYEFKTQSVPYQTEFNPSISVGQLLLDLAWYQANFSRFQQLFPTGSLLQLSSNWQSLGNDNELHQLVACELVEPIAIEQLKYRLYLGDCKFSEVILDLFDKGLVVTPISSPVQEICKVGVKRQERVKGDSNWALAAVLLIFLALSVYFPLLVWSDTALSLIYR